MVVSQGTGIPEQHLSVRGSCLPAKTPASAFVASGGSYIVELGDEYRNLPGKVALLSAELGKLRASDDKKSAEMDELRASHDKKSAEMVEQSAEIGKLRGRITYIEEESGLYRRVALRHVLCLVFKKLEGRFGDKTLTQSWQDYVQDAYNRDTSWFNENQLSFGELALLAKGPSTAYQAGNNAAHKPALHLVERAVQEAAMLDSSWTSLWACAQRTE